MAKDSGRVVDFDKVKAFPFTEARVEDALRAVQAGAVTTKADGRRWWRDDGCQHGLYLAATKIGGTYYRINFTKGKRVYRRIGDATTKRVLWARGVALKLAGGDNEAAPPPIRVRTDGVTVAQAWEAYLADTKSGTFIAGRKPTSPSTIKSYEELYNPHLKKQYGGKSLHSLARGIEDLHATFRDRPATGNRLLQLVRNIFTHAIRKGTWAGSNPTLDPATGRGLRKYTVEARSRFLTTDEAARVLAHAETEVEPWRDFWRLLVLTGVRSSNLREMRWADVDIETEPTWSIPMTKNGQTVVKLLVGWAAEILRDRIDRTQKDEKGRPISPWVFPMKEDATRPICDLDHAWARVKEAAGLENVHIHDLRRTAGSWATIGGAPLPAVGGMLGHKSANATAVYARVDAGATRAASEIVERRLLEAQRLSLKILAKAEAAAKAPSKPK
jgi:integrase